MKEHRHFAKAVFERTVVASNSHRSARRTELRKFLSGAVCSFMVLLTLAGAAYAQSALTDDADVNCLLPLNGCGAGVGLSLAPGANVYVKFKLSSTLPASTPGAQVARATLKLYVNDISAAGAIDVYQAGAAWSEKTITAGNAPLPGLLIAEGVAVQSDMKGQFLVIDVTPAVQQWLGTDGSGTGGMANYGVVLVARNGAKATFDSKESLLTSHEPGLNVQLKSGGGVTSVSADGPLTVTNSTTTPNISLGVVSTTNGGTGISSSGASGNILRSDGSAWTSVPFSASDFPAGNGNYIQNATGQQAAANFNIAGKGSANILEAATQFNLNGNRALAAPGTNNLVGGIGAGASLATGQANTFFGSSAGQAVTAANGNSFFGRDTGRLNTGGVNNSFLGDRAGASNTTGNFNSFYGEQAGVSNSTGSSNSFYGRVAGFNNTTGTNNTFIGTGAGNSSPSTQVNNSTAIGAGATVSTSNTIVLGTSAQTTLLSGGVASTFNLGLSAPSGIIANNLIFRNANITPSPAHVCMRLFSTGTDGGWAFTSCTSEFSSANNKTDVQPFSGGLDVINRLQPVAFAWKEDGRRGVGLNAEDVAELAPQLVTRNQNGEVEDLQEGSLNVLFINAIKEQQKRIEIQQQQIDALKTLVCQSNPQAEACQSKQ